MKGKEDNRMLRQIKPAIFENLDELYNDTYHLENETTFHHVVIDTGDLLQRIRYQIEFCVKYLLEDNIPNLEMQLDAIDLIANEGLDRLGHRMGESMTGPYAVRLGIIDRIRAMLHYTLPFQMPTYNHPGYSFYMPYSDSKVKVNLHRVEFTKYHVVSYLQPELFCIDDTMCNCHKWESCDEYNSKHLPYFMTIETYERIDL